MSIKLTCRSIRDVTIVDCAGRPTIGEGATELRYLIWDLIKSGRNKIILNLSEVSYIDSAGIAELVSSFAAVFLLALYCQSKTLRSPAGRARFASILCGTSGR